VTSDCILLSLPQGLERVRVEGWTHQPFDLGEGEEQGYHRAARPRGEWLPAPAAMTLRGGPERTSVWYRAAFTHPGWAERTLLRFDGAFMAANVWLNGRLLGSHYGHPGAFGFDVSSFLQVENTLAVCVQATPEGGFLPPALAELSDDGGRWWPLGLVDRVWLERVGSVAVESLDAAWRLTPGMAEARLRTVLRNLDAREMEVTVGWQLSPPEEEEPAGPVARWRRTATLAGRGVKALETRISLDRPRLWWPWTLGAQALHGLAVTVDCGDRRSTVAQREVGVREIHLEPFGGGLAWMVNGRRHFPRGAVLPPLPPGEGGDPVGAWRLAGLDLALSRGQVPGERTAAMADRSGVMLVVDPPPSPAAEDDGDEQDHVREAIAQMASHASAAVLLQRGAAEGMDLPATTAAEEPYTVTAADRAEVEAVRREKFSPATALVLERLPDLDEAQGAMATTTALLDWSLLPDREGLLLRFSVVNDDAAAAGRATVRWSVRPAQAAGWRLRRERRGELEVGLPAPDAPPAVHEVEVATPVRDGILVADVQLEREGATMSRLTYEIDPAERAGRTGRGR
jgi:hypothetical protein